jgi:hypothetical protein
MSEQPAGPDIVRLRENLAAIKANLEHWDQADYAVRAGMGEDWTVFPRAAGAGLPPCGTTFCLAGWDAFLHAPQDATIDTCHEEVSLAGNARQHISFFATRGMRLTEGQAEALFDPANTLGDLYAMADYLEERPGASGETLYALAERIMDEDPED